MDRKRQIENLERLLNLNKDGIVETPEMKKLLTIESPVEKQLKNIAIALRGIEAQLNQLNKELRRRPLK